MQQIRAPLVQSTSWGCDVHSQCIPGVRDYLEWCNTGCPPAIKKSHKGCPTAVAKHSEKFGLWCSWLLPLFIAMQPGRIWRGRRKQVALLWQEGTEGPFAMTLHSLFPQNFIIRSCTKSNQNYLETSTSILIQPPDLPEASASACFSCCRRIAV